MDSWDVWSKIAKDFTLLSPRALLRGQAFKKVGRIWSDSLFMGGVRLDLVGRALTGLD